MQGHSRPFSTGRPAIKSSARSEALATRNQTAPLFDICSRRLADYRYQTQERSGYARLRRLLYIITVPDWSRAGSSACSLETINLQVCMEIFLYK